MAIAEEADFRGADVTLIRTRGGSVSSFVENQIEVETVEEMLAAIESELKARRYDVVVLAAAVSDFCVKEKAQRKIKSGKSLTLELEPTPKIIDRVKELQPDAFLVGFKAETARSEEELVSAARKQIERAGSDLVVANTLNAFGSEENEVVLVGEDFVKKLPRMGKRELAERLWDEIISILG